MSRLNNQNSLNYGNKETHIFTEFGTLAKENTQKEVLEAIKNININIEGGTFEASDTITHQKLDTLNTTVTNKHLNITNDSVSVGCDIIEVGAVSDIYNKKALVNASNVYAYNSGSSSIETITFSNSSYVETEETKNRLDTTAILVDSVNNENKIRIKPANSTMDSTYNGVVTDSILFGTKSNGDIVGVALTNDKEIKVSANISNTSIEVTGSIDANITNDVIVVDPINNSINEAPYDLLLNGPTLWADTTPLANPFFADLNGREGWYYDNFSNIANKSNIYWYANPVSGNLQENDMTFAQLSGMYCIITPDFVENGSLTIPTMGIYSQPTGTNDFIPGFAHSRWVYQLNSTNLSKLRKAETIILYTGATRPEVYLNIPAYPLNLSIQNGDALSSEIIAYMSVNTQATTSKIGYLLQYTGFLNSAIGFNREFQFKNSKERVIQNNQYSGSINISNSSIPVTGAFYPETQPISGNVGITGTPTVTVGNSSIAVTGAFYPETQPISGNVGITGTPTVTVGNTSIPVTGAFYPETQPISGSISITGTPTVNTGLDISSLATEATLGSIKQKTEDISFNVVGTDKCLNVNVANDLNISTMPHLSASTDSIELYAMNASSELVSVSCNATGNLDIVGNVTATISGTPTIKINDSDGYKIGAVSSTLPQLKTTLYDKVGNPIESNETSVGSGLYALKTFNNELNAAYNSTAFALQTATQVYDGSSYYQQKGDAQGRTEVNINSNGTTLNNTGGSLDVQVKNSGNINVSVQNTSLDTHIMGYDENTLTYKDVSVDSNGFLNVNTIEAAHENIHIGFDENVDKLTKYKGSSGYMTWKAQNAYSKQQNGWYVTGDAANMAALSWYNNGDFVAGGGNPTIPFYSQYNFTKADIDIWYMIIQNYNCNSLLATFPFILVMSKPTGTGDYAPYAHSIWVYSINANQFINNGSSIMIYNGNLARVKTNDIEAPRVSYSLMNTLGDGGNNEVIGHITMETQPYPSSGITIDLNVIEGAVYVKNKSLINYYFDNNRENVLSGSNILTDKSSNSVTSSKLENSSYNAVGLDTKANLYASFSGTSQPISYTSTSSPNVSYSLDCFIQNSSTANNYSKIGLNTYNIYPKKKSFIWSGRTNDNLNADTILGGLNGNVAAGQNLGYNSYSFGITPHVFYAQGNINNLTLLYSYVNSSGNLVSDISLTLTTAGTYYALASGAAIFSLLKFEITTNNNSAACSIYYNTTTNTTSRVAYSSANQYWNGLFMVPNGWVGKITNFNIYCSASQQFVLFKYSNRNYFKQVMATFNNASNSVLPISDGLGGIIEGGELVLLSRTVIATETQFSSCITMEQVS